MPDQVDWRTAEREATPGRAVGRLLRDQREARGLSVVDIEKRLRLRRSHVEAIEAGRFDLLPGAAYIPAFLRTYANFLELDPEKVLSAYQSSGAVPIKRPVALPADFPIVEKRAPIGLAVLTVLLVVGAGYAVWHYLPRQQSVVAEKVPPVPDRLLATIPAAAPSAPVSPAPASPSVSEPAKQAAQPAPPTQTLPNGLPVETWPAPRQSGSTAAAPQAAPPPAPPIVVAVPVPPPPVVMSAPSIGQAQAAQPAAEAQEARAVQPEPAAPSAVAPQVSLPVRTDTPLLMRTNSWIELRAPNGDILAMTYVRAGESYTVPAGISYRVIDAR